MAAEASYNTDIDSMSLLLILSQPETPCTPSTTTSGSVFPVVFLPRINKTLLSLPGSPEVFLVTTPGNNPARVLVIFVLGVFAISLLETLATDPVKVTLRCVPYPTTTTSSRL